MYRQLRHHYWWAGMERECHSFAAACEKCGGTRSQATMVIPVGSAPTPNRPFEVIHLDHKGELPACDNYKHVLAVVCALTAAKNCALVLIQLSASTPVAAVMRRATLSAA